eukprot:1160220-Pleurochrysis_carterae.AAC.2
MNHHRTAGSAPAATTGWHAKIFNSPALRQAELTAVSALLAACSKMSGTFIARSADNRVWKTSADQTPNRLKPPLKQSRRLNPPSKQTRVFSADQITKFIFRRP